MTGAQSTSATRHWDSLTDQQQLTVSRAALRVAIQTVAGQADLLAGDIEQGMLPDHGGAESLRLLAVALRVSGENVADPLAGPLDGLAAGHDPGLLATMTVAGHG